mgnify:CR=1 FL=1
MNKGLDSFRLLKWLLLVFALVLIAYGVMAVLYSLEQRSFRLPELPLLPRAGGL